MTEKQFWTKLERLSGRKESMLEAVRLIRQAYDENLNVICGVKHKGKDTYNQLYVNIIEEQPNSENNRYMLCYTSWNMASSDPLLSEPCETLPIRFVVDNMINKPVIGGIVFNRHSQNKNIIVPKQLLDGKSLFETIKNVMNNDPNPFHVPVGDKGDYL